MHALCCCPSASQSGQTSQGRADPFGRSEAGQSMDRQKPAVGSLVRLAGPASLPFKSSLQTKATKLGKGLFGLACQRFGARSARFEHLPGEGSNF